MCVYTIQYSNYNKIKEKLKSVITMCIYLNVHKEIINKKDKKMSNKKKVQIIKGHI